MTFQDFDIPTELAVALERMNYIQPTPIQQQAIPVALAGRDILGSAQTGTGKTAAFSIPLLAALMQDSESSALVLTPTRELATQVLEAIRTMIGEKSKLRTSLLIGGMPMYKQLKALERKPHIIVGTPGRVNDHLDRGSLRLENTKFLVLDETDRMLDMGFSVQIDEIVQYLPRERQTLLFSATLPSSIIKLSNKYLTNPERIAVDSMTTPVAKIKQEMVNVSEADKYPMLLTELESRTGSIIIFVKTRRGADQLAFKLHKERYEAKAIHGDLRQRERERIVQSFRDEKCRILVATDVVGRGLDIPHIGHVINFDLPESPEDYIHRIGRTGRAGAEGFALSFVSPQDKRKHLAIERMLNPDKRSDKDDGFSGPVKRSRGERGRFRSRSDSGRRHSGSGGRKPSFDSRSRFEGYEGGRPSRSNKPQSGSKGEIVFSTDRGRDGAPPRGKFNSSRKPNNSFPFKHQRSSRRSGK